MNIVDIIIKKRDKHELSEEEINFFIEEYCKDNIKDYQASSLLMACYLNGLNDTETYYLTKAIIKSGETLDLSGINGITVDKHSTGGVGDKTTLVLVPLLASLGVNVLKMSGRGLGHTGGTIDKFDSIPNFKTELKKKEFIKQVNEIGCCLVSQSQEIALADKKLYALRDVTGTVDNASLIAASIMSKKIALNTDIICLDVKVGNGAFFKTLKAATQASKLMIKIGKMFNKKVSAVISSMDQPLGYAIGNSLEVNEAIDTLKGNGPKDLEETCIELAYQILKQTNKFDNTLLKDAIKENLHNNKAYNKFVQLVEKQGGKIPIPTNKKIIKTQLYSKYSGYINEIDTFQLGKMLVELGGGRKYKEQEINYDVGIIIKVKINDFVKENDLLFEIYSSGPLNSELQETILNCIKYSNRKRHNLKSIYKIIN
jgi:pyrimidine-nucleoside phosphorylase